MLRLLFSFLVVLSVSRWVMAEVEILCPQYIPAIEEFLSYIEIPTHDEWDLAAFADRIRTFRDGLELALEQASEGKANRGKGRRLSYYHKDYDRQALDRVIAAHDDRIETPGGWVAIQRF